MSRLIRAGWATQNRIRAHHHIALVNHCYEIQDEIAIDPTIDDQRGLQRGREFSSSRHVGLHGGHALLDVDHHPHDFGHDGFLGVGRGHHAGVMSSSSRVGETELAAEQCLRAAAFVTKWASCSTAQ